MKITINRTSVNSHSITGELYVDGKFICYTLELPYRDNKSSVSSIPAGNYGGNLRYDHTDKWRIELTGTESRKNIQIHTGNAPEHTEGCILVGKNVFPSQNRVSDSQVAYKELMKAFYGTSLAVMTPDVTIDIEITSATDYLKHVGQEEQNLKLIAAEENKLKLQRAALEQKAAKVLDKDTEHTSNADKYYADVALYKKRVVHYDVQVSFFPAKVRRWKEGTCGDYHDYEPSYITNERNALSQESQEIDAETDRLNNWGDELVANKKALEREAGEVLAEDRELTKQEEALKEKKSQKEELQFTCSEGVCSIVDTKSDRKFINNNNAGASLGYMKSIAELKPQVESTYNMGIHSSSSYEQSGFVMVLIYSAFSTSYQFICDTLTVYSTVENRTTMSQETDYQPQKQENKKEEQFTSTSFAVNVVKGLFGIPGATLREHAAAVNSNPGFNLTSKEYAAQHVNQSLSFGEKVIVGEYIVYHAKKYLPITLPWNKNHTLSFKVKNELLNYQKIIVTFEKTIAAQKLSRAGQSNLFKDEFNLLDKSLLEVKQNITSILSHHKTTDTRLSDIRGKINRIEEIIHKIAQYNKELKKNAVNEARLERRNRYTGKENAVITRYNPISGTLKQEVKELAAVSANSSNIVEQSPLLTPLLAKTQQFWSTLSLEQLQTFNATQRLPIFSATPQLKK